MELLTKREVKMAIYWTRTKPISSHLDRPSLVNKGFIIWLYLQVKATKYKENKLFCSDRNSSQPAGVRFIFRAFLDKHVTMENCEPEIILRI